jgi:hypothetical protein
MGSGLADVRREQDGPLAVKAFAVLRARCFQCHAGDAKGGLDLRTRAAALKGGGRGPALRLGDPGGSLLYRLIAGQAQPAMPQGAPLPAAEIALLRTWIDRRAPWPSTPTTQHPAPNTQHSPNTLPRRHWAFKTPVRPALPMVRNAAWVRNPVDVFVLAKLESRGLTPSLPADPRTLLRRVTLDLTGLPPAPEEIRAFLADRSPDAYEKVVRRLLDSPRYGERWAQHWLDAVRFAETNGFELDGERPQAWRYRDWVVRALNQDLPYDRFLLAQIAGDEIEPEDFEMRVATGFLRAGPQHVVGGNVDPVELRQEWLTEAVSGVGNAVMGLTIGCARCHDHKYDPVPTKDYYRLQAFFAATESHDLTPAAPAEQQAYEAAVKAHQERLKPLRDEIAAIEKPYRERLRQQKLEKLEPQYAQALATPADKRTRAQQQLAQEAPSMLKIDWDELVAALGREDREKRAALRRRMHALEREAPAPLPSAPGVADKAAPPPAVHVLLRGDPHVRGEEVQPGFPGILLAAGDPRAGQPAVTGPGGRRTALARWLTRPDHPLTARVMVNRLWQHHFGRGLVATPNDFGLNGRPPTHPELLDYLAARFAGVQSPTSKVQSPGEHDPGLGTRDPGLGLGWSLKKLHYLIVTSSAYRQSSGSRTRRLRAAVDPQSTIRNPQSIDPENRLLWRMNRRRLDAEALRDCVLHAAGTLNLEAGGPPVRVPLEPEVYDQIFTEGEPDNLWPVTLDPKQHTRRSLYLLRKRNVRLPMLAVFDQPDMMTSCAARGESVHALQALTLMNSRVMSEQSRAMAARLLQGPRGAGRESAGRATVVRLYELTLGRPPRAGEAGAAERFLTEQAEIIRVRIARGEAVARLDGLPPETSPAMAAAWVDLCLAHLNLTEFVYIR